MSLHQPQQTLFPRLSWAATSASAPQLHTANSRSGVAERARAVSSSSPTLPPPRSLQYWRTAQRTSLALWASGPLRLLHSSPSTAISTPAAPPSSAGRLPPPPRSPSQAPSPPPPPPPTPSRTLPRPRYLQRAERGLQPAVARSALLRLAPGGSCRSTGTDSRAARRHLSSVLPPRQISSYQTMASWASALPLPHTTSPSIRRRVRRLQTPSRRSPAAGESGNGKRP